MDTSRRERNREDEKEKREKSAILVITFWIELGIRSSSSNIIDELGENEDTRANSAAELVNSEER